VPMCRPSAVSSLMIRASPPRQRKTAAARLRGIPFATQSRSSSAGEITSMSDTLPLASLTPDDVQTAVREAMRDGLDAASIDDSLASVDWSGAQNLPPVAILLGGLEAAATSFAEGDLSADDVAARLQALLVSPSIREDRAQYDAGH
jgi:hypothetical protein